MVHGRLSPFGSVQARLLRPHVELGPKPSVRNQLSLAKKILRGEPVVDGERLSTSAALWHLAQADRLRLRIDYRPKVHFLHIGKTGGTALRAALLDAKTETSPIALVYRRHATTLADIPHGDKIVFFIRHPVSRFVSGFNSRRRDGGRYVVSWTDGERAAFGSFDSPSRLAGALGSNDARQRAAAEHAMRSVNHVRFGYRDWLGPADSFEQRLDDILFIGVQERFDADCQRLFELLGVDATLPKDPVLAHRSPGPKELSAAESDTMHEFLADDIAYYERLLALADEINERSATQAQR